MDGHGENLSNNWGVEGETADEHISAIRDKVARSLLATLFFSHGTPMLLGGDEIARTQRGNNNAYCQDNDVSWFDWAALLSGDENAASLLYRFTARAIALRKAHPSLRSEQFLHGRLEVLPGIFDVAWFDEKAEALTMEAWSDIVAQLLALRRAAVEADTVDITLLLLNATHEDREFTMPNPEFSWEMKLDSALPDAAPELLGRPSVIVGAHGAMLLAVTMPQEENA
jgi:glycogen operon protein